MSEGMRRRWIQHERQETTGLGLPTAAVPKLRDRRPVVVSKQVSGYEEGSGDCRENHLLGMSSWTDLLPGPETKEYHPIPSIRLNVNAAFAMLALKSC